MEDHHEPEMWTLTSLREYLLRVIADQATKQSQLADAQDKAVQAALVAQEKAVQAALAAADKAVAKAEEGATAWRISANEWRGAMSDRERTFIPRTEHEQAIRTLNEKMDLLQTWMTGVQGASRGHSEVWGYIALAVSLLVGALAIGSHLVKP
jgi:hypothetical protein